MASNVDNSCRSMAGRLSAKVQKKLGVLALPHEQRSLDSLGTSRWSVRSYCLTDLSCLFEYKRSSKEPVAGKLADLSRAHSDTTRTFTVAASIHGTKVYRKDRYVWIWHGSGGLCDCFFLR